MTTQTIAANRSAVLKAMREDSHRYATGQYLKYLQSKNEYRCCAVGVMMIAVGVSTGQSAIDTLKEITAALSPADDYKAFLTIPTDFIPAPHQGKIKHVFGRHPVSITFEQYSDMVGADSWAIIADYLEAQWFPQEQPE